MKNREKSLKSTDCGTCLFSKKNPLNRGLTVLDNGFVICEKFMAGNMDIGILYS